MVRFVSGGQFKALDEPEDEGDAATTTSPPTTPRGSVKSPDTPSSSTSTSTPATATAAVAVAEVPAIAPSSMTAAAAAQQRAKATSPPNIGLVSTATAASSASSSSARPAMSATVSSFAASAANATFVERTSTRGATRTREESMTRLQQLRDLYEQGFITQVEYNERKAQLVDDLTGTKTRITKTRHNGAQFMPITVTNRPPPDFTTIPTESAVKHTFNPKTGRWTATRIKVKVESEPFAKGGLRVAFHMLDLSETSDASATYVGKMAIDPDEDRQTYFQDAEMQNYSMEWAKKFNESKPPKLIEFVRTWVVELVDRPDRNLCAVELYIAGVYRKHNNNYGFVNEDERNTPQAFSHFTYEASGRRVLVCDIQGVADKYTDPQMHTINGQGFGKGNLGQRGFDKFLSTHRCNAICRYLRLPPVNAKLVDMGTVPATPYMSYQRVDSLNVTVPPSSLLHQQLNPSTPLLVRTVPTNKVDGLA